MKRLLIFLMITIFAAGIVANGAMAKSKAQSEDKTVVAKADTTKAAKATAKGKININKATVEELAELKGVGPALADRIVEYRKKSGGFKNVEQIMEVKGIGEKTFKEIKKLISI